MAKSQTLSLVEMTKFLPKNYKFIKSLSSGGFGQVVQCKTKDTRMDVAVKLPLYQQNTKKEITLLTRMKEEGCDRRNIVNFFGAFDTPLGKGMIFELLDMSVEDYYIKYAPLPLPTVATIMKQVATALEALKEWSIIHADMKLDNVMVVDHKQWPLQVKLIDFGLARPVNKAFQGTRIHHVCYRAPEIILGLPWNEAVDVWCLGIMFGTLWLRRRLIPNTTENEAVKVMVNLFGAPPDHVLSQGLRTETHFKQIDNRWILKTRMSNRSNAESFHDLRHLVEELCSHSRSRRIDLQIEAATDLLIQMLKMDASARITPSQILQHPFIRLESEANILKKKKERSKKKPKENTTEQRCEDLNESRGPIDRPLTQEELMQILPEGYKLTRMLGNGNFGQFVRCRQEDTGNIVTVKLPYINNRTRREIQLLRKISEVDQQNIVRFLDTLQTSCGKLLVLEKLNLSLAEYMDKNHPLPIDHLRSIVQQTATALVDLKSKKLIHTGVMVESIWICSSSQEPPRIKLTDFGAAVNSKKAEVGMTVQLVTYRAPEIILGLHFTEAIDVWSLGYMLVYMLIGRDMFPNYSEVETLTSIVKLLGQPSDKVLGKALYTKQFFTESQGCWKLMTPKEFEERYDLLPGDIQTHDLDSYNSVEELIESRLRISEQYHRHELVDCLNLVKEMLNVNADQRITATRILKHPFICQRSPMAEAASQEQADLVQQTSVREPVVIVVQPAAPENTRPLKEEDQQMEGQRSPMAEAASQEQADLVQQTSVREPVVIVVQPAAPENTSPLKEEDYKQGESHMGAAVSLEQVDLVQQTPVLIVVKSYELEPISPFEQEDYKPVERKRSRKVRPLPVCEQEVRPLPVCEQEVRPLPVCEQEVRPLPVCEQEVRPLPVPKRKVRLFPFRKRKVQPLPLPSPSVKATVLPETIPRVSPCSAPYQPPPGDTAPQKKRTGLQRVFSWLNCFSCCTVDQV